MTYPSLLTREESGAMKGLLILLVVLGHNSMLMEATGLFPYLYSFHVYCFYILPFVYGMTINDDVRALPVLYQRLRRNVKTYYPLYIIWSILSLSITHFVKHQNFQLLKVIIALLFGNSQLREYCGSAFLWFLPTIVAVMFWRDLYFLLPKAGKQCLMGAALLIWLLAIFGVMDYRLPGDFIPFSLYSGLAFSFSGILTRWILVRMPKAKWKVLLFLPIFAIVLLFISFRSHFPSGCVYLSWSVMPVFAFVALVQLREWLAECSWLLFLGRYSLELYLVHVFIYNGLSLLWQKHSLTCGLFLYLLTLFFSLLFILLAKQTPLQFLFAFTAKKVSGKNV